MNWKRSANLWNKHDTGNSYRVAEVSCMITSDSTFGKPIDQFATFWESGIRKSNFASGTIFRPKMSDLAPCIGQQVFSLRWSAFASSGLRARCHPTSFFLDDDRYKFNRLVINAEKYISRRVITFKFESIGVKVTKARGLHSTDTFFLIQCRPRRQIAKWLHPQSSRIWQKIGWFKKNCLKSLKSTIQLMIAWSKTQDLSQSKSLVQA